MHTHKCTYRHYTKTCGEISRQTKLSSKKHAIHTLNTRTCLSRGPLQFVGTSKEGFINVKSFIPLYIKAETLSFSYYFLDGRLKDTFGNNFVRIFKGFCKDQDWFAYSVLGKRSLISFLIVPTFYNVCCSLSRS